ncbi:hypothetical protein [Streptomyces sp900129855]|uniref:Uncharacterized protein n=1 Tax=Streptomyces sp. 900129855 TaxID=3155129 RepID=A0ABV2ZY02_9ACTN
MTCSTSSTGAPGGASSRRQVGVSTPWRQFAIARIHELQAREETLRVRYEAADRNDPGTKQNLELLKQIRTLLEKADDSARHKFALLGGSVERVWNHIYAAETRLLEAAPKDELAAWGWDALAMAEQHLGVNDTRRKALKDRLVPTKLLDLTVKDRELAVHTLRVAQAVASNEKMQARSFRNTVCFGILILTLLAVWLCILGGAKPNPLQVCFDVSQSSSLPGPAAVSKSFLVCPASDKKSQGAWDVILIESIGAAAAALTGALSLRHLDGTSTPYAIPRTLALLKVPAGALSAVIGLLLVNAGIVPGLQLKTRAALLAWAAIFGAGQHTITRYVDSKGQEVLDNVRGSESRRVSADATGAQQTTPSDRL